MQELDSRKKAKAIAEFITPKPLRAFLADHIKGENLRVLEPSIGSGQLLFNSKDRIQSIVGYDVNGDVAPFLKENFGNVVEFHNESFISCDLQGDYDVAISNYPFSLKPSQEECAAILQDPFLSSFYNGKVTGVLDFIFILKSFAHAKEGLYFSSPGIGYRKQELNFRKYLVDNKFLKRFGILENCGFEFTSINVLFLQLSKTPSDYVFSFRKDFETGQVITRKITTWNENYTFENIHFEKPVELFDIDKLEAELDALIIEREKKTLALDECIRNIKIFLEHRRDNF